MGIVVLCFSQCSSAQLDAKAPSTITDSFYQEWIGGRPGSKGTLLTIKMNNPKKKVVFDSIYFNHKAVKLTSTLDKNELTLIGNFVHSTKNNLLTVDADPKKEFGNKRPLASQKIPFELQQNEAVITYFINSKKRYFKLTQLKKRKAIYHQ